MKNFFEELRRRHIFRVALTYLVVAWLLIQVINNIAAPLDLPAWAPTLMIVLVALGFPVALVIAWAFDPPQKAEATSDAEAPRRPAPAFGRKWDFVIIAGLVIALGYSLWGREIVGEDAGPAAPGASTEASVAVLPFADISPKGDQEYFADGVSEEILNSLARISDLQVAGRTSSFYFKDKNEDLRTIGEKLNVAHILEGSVRKSGDQVRITAQLVNAESGYHLWSDTYDRRLEDIFSVQGDIAESVADALEITLGVGSLGRQPGMTRDVEAYDAYLQGRQLSGSTIAETLRDAIDSLERAVAIDPSFGLAWAELTGAYIFLGNIGDAANSSEWQRKADEALARARALAPEAPAVLVRSAGIALRRGDWTRADRLYRKALAGHNEANARNGFSQFLLAAGKAEDAVPRLEEARRTDPLQPFVPVLLGRAYLISGQTQKAFAEFDRGERIGGVPGFMRGGALIAALAGGDRQEIERRLDAVLKSEEPVARPVNTAMRKVLHDREAALTELRRLFEERDEAPAIGWAVLAGWAAYFGDPELALRAIKKAWSRGGRPTLMALWDPMMSDVHNLPGFKDFVRKIRLVDYWRQTGWNDFCRPVGEDDFECE